MLKHDCLNFCLFKIDKRKFTNNIYKYGNTSKNLKTFPKMKISNDYIAGFIYIYKTFLFALKEKDENFIINNVETNFAQKILNEFRNKETPQLYINANSPETDSLQVTKETLIPEIDIGITTNRSGNRSLGIHRVEYLNDNPGRMEKLLNSVLQDGERIMKFHKSANEDIIQNVVLRLKMDISSELILRKEEKADNTEEIAPEIHSIIIETDLHQVSDLLGLFDSKVIKVYSMLKFGKKSSDTNLDWKISDFDNYMNGNPLI